jgi:phenylacetate-CoA ligase
MPVDPTELGCEAQALAVAREMARQVPAYRAALAAHGVDPSRLEAGAIAWRELPVLDKASYVTAHAWRDLMPEAHRRNTWSVSSSSGTGGAPFYWPITADAVLDATAPAHAPDARDLPMSRPASVVLQEAFDVWRHRTLFVAAFPLGSWRAGAFFALFGQGREDLTSVAPGPDADQIAPALVQLGAEFERIVLAIPPSRLRPLMKALEPLAVPRDKLRFLLLGEPFAEETRTELTALIQPPGDEPAAISVYGSADTGPVGVESRWSVALRALLSAVPAAASALGLSHPVENLYHAVNCALVELCGDELTFTRWQGVPLARYNLHDRGRFLAVDRVSGVLRDTAVPPELEPLRAGLLARRPLGDLIVFSGRTGDLRFYGPLLALADLRAAVAQPALAPYFTGELRVALRQGALTQLHWQLELRPGLALGLPDPSIVAAELVREVARLDPRFAQVCRRHFPEHESLPPEQRPFVVEIVAWPELTRRAAQAPKPRVL